MASELTITAKLNYAPAAGPKIASDASGVVLTVTGVPAIKSVISVGTGDETLALGDVGTIGYVLLRNLDLTNYISVGSDGTLYPLKLKAGEAALFRWNAAAIHCKSNTAACNLEYTILSD